MPSFAIFMVKIHKIVIMDYNFHYYAEQYYYLITKYILKDIIKIIYIFI
jgi:hypothetical protein